MVKLIDAAISQDKPFSNEYFEKELKSFAISPQQYNNIDISFVDVDGRYDGYMYKYFGSLKNIPVLRIDKKLWMSITPMEIQSHYMPILLAGGVVGVGGLGMGYYVQKILNKDTVVQVVVYETDQNIIDLYLKNFGEHPKLEIINQDVLTVKNKEFDFFYMDIYPSGMDDNVFKDMAILCENNMIDIYHFWTLEAFVLELANEKYFSEIPWIWKMRYFPFLSELISSKKGLCETVGMAENIIDMMEAVNLKNIV